MNNVKEYLNKHLVKDYGYCKHYKTLKACIIGSIDGTTTYWKDDLFFCRGLPADQYHKKYNCEKILPLFDPRITTNLKA